VVLQEWLSPVGIEVISEVLVTSKPQKADILLLTHEDQAFTTEQLYRLADGLRQSKASHLLLEFKYTESLSKDAIKQIMGYEVAYRTGQKLKANQLDSFLLCSKSPHAEILTHLGYNLTKYPGVYKNQNPVLADTVLLSLNDLSDEPHNLPLKCFASKMREKRKAYLSIQNDELKGISQELEYTLEGLWALYFREGIEKMSNMDALTPEYVKQMGKQRIEHILSVLTPEERLKGLSAEDRLKGLPAEDRLKGLPAEDRLKGLSKEDLRLLKEKLDQL